MLLLVLCAAYGPFGNLLLAKIVSSLNPKSLAFEIRWRNDINCKQG